MISCSIRFREGVDCGGLQGLKKWNMANIKILDTITQLEADFLYLGRGNNQVRRAGSLLQTTDPIATLWSLKRKKHLAHEELSA